jgi:DNA-directed RNA polymerase specialized sigma24 family protein
MTEWEGMVQQIATETKRQFPMVEREDIVQELWLWIAGHQEKVEKWAGEGKNGERRLATSLRRRGRSYAVHEKAAITGYDVGDNYWYSTGQLREILPMALDREVWADPGVAPETGKLSRTTAPSEGNNRLAMLCDVRSGLEAGSAVDKELLWTHFGLGLDKDEHALVLGVTVETLEKRLQRAVQRLQKRLGGPKPDGLYVGSRRAISNAQAQALTRSQEAEE